MLDVKSFSRILKDMKLASVMLNSEGKIIFINDYLLNVTGWLREEVLEKSWFDLFVPSIYREQLIEMFLKMNSDANIGTLHHVECIQTRDGEYRYIGWNSTVLRDKKGNVLCLTCLGEDVTYRRIAEENLKTAKENAEQLYRVVPCAIFTVDKNKIITSVSKKAVEKLGLPAEAITGQPCSTFCWGECCENCLLFEAQVQKPCSGYEGFIRRSDGTVLTVLKNLDLLKDSQGNVVGGIETFEDITELKQTEAALRKSEERYRDLFENASDLIQSVNLDGSFEYVNNSWYKTLGYTEKEISKLKLKDIIHSDYSSQCNNLFQQVLEGRSLFNINAIFKTKQGNRVEVEGNVSCRFEDGKPVTTRGMFRDITKRNQTERALREIDKRYRTLFEKIMNPIWVVDDQGKCIDCNESACRFLECSKAQLLSLNLFTRVFFENISDFQNRTALWTEGGLIEASYETKGQKKVLEVTITPAQLNGNRVYFWLGNDITERKLAEERIKYLAYHDQLTGIPNRMFFMERLKEAIQEAERNNHSLSLLFLDLDHFKKINDTFGHSMGDNLLVLVAERLKSSLKTNDIVARLGGDEFTILVQNTNMYKVNNLCNKIFESFKSPFIYNNQEFYITPSIGIAIYPDDGVDGETLLQKADVAMYRIKSLRRNNIAKHE